MSADISPDILSSPQLPVENNEPIFNEPWEAQAFALVVDLHAKGHFSWGEWAKTLAGVLNRAGQEEPYYVSWLKALERISRQHNMVQSHEQAVREKAWRKAEALTPHGEPIALERAARRA